MEQDLKQAIEDLLVAQVLTLAKAIEAEKRARGSSSTDHYVPEAVALIRQQGASILARLAQSH